MALKNSPTEEYENLESSNAIIPQEQEVLNAAETKTIEEAGKNVEAATEQEKQKGLNIEKK
jgi:hypothetical protein